MWTSVCVLDLLAALSWLSALERMFDFYQTFARFYSVESTGESLISESVPQLVKGHTAC